MNKDKWTCKTQLVHSNKKVVATAHLMLKPPSHSCLPSTLLFIFILAATLQLKKCTKSASILTSLQLSISGKSHWSRCTLHENMFRIPPLHHSTLDFSTSVYCLQGHPPTYQEPLQTHNQCDKLIAHFLAVSHRCDHLPYMEGTPKLQCAGMSKDLKASQMLKLKRRCSLSRE